MGETNLPHFRYTMIFQYLSGPSTGTALNLKGGWSESVYWNDNSSGTLTSFRRLATARAVLLPLRSYISGIRIQQVNPTGAAQTIPANYQGGMILNQVNSDIPQMALLLRVRSSSTSNVRTMRLAALPDSVVNFGEYAPPDNQFPQALNYYFGQLSGWLFQCRDLTVRPVNLASIDVNGVVVPQADVTAVQGQTVRISGAIDSNRILRSGTFKIGTYTNSRLFTINNWTFGPCTLGTVTVYNLIYPAIVADSTSISRIVTRKIGRPSLGYRGRRSGRRRRSQSVAPVG